MKLSITVLVCGGRNYSDSESVNRVLDKIDPVLVIQGGAKGADALAKEWCLSRGKHCAEIRPLWSRYGKSAGHLRNAAMIRLKPSIVIAFPGGRGTADMVKRARAAGIYVMVADSREAAEKP